MFYRADCFPRWWPKHAGWSINRSNAFEEAAAAAVEDDNKEPDLDIWSDGVNNVGVHVVWNAVSRLCSRQKSNKTVREDTVGYKLLAARAAREETHKSNLDALEKIAHSKLKKHEKDLAERKRLVVVRNSSMATHEAAACVDPPPERRSQSKKRPSPESESDTTDTCPKPKKGRYCRCCAFPSCDSNSENFKGSWHRIPPHEKRVPEPGMRMSKLRSIGKKKFLHAESLRRVGLGSKPITHELRVCSKHGVEEVEKWYPITTFKRQKDGGWDERTTWEKAMFTVVTDKGEKSTSAPAASLSKGIGRDRVAIRLLNDAMSKAPDPGIALGFQQAVERTATEKTPVHSIPGALASEAGLNQYVSPPSTPQKKRFRVASPKKKRNAKRPARAANAWEHAPVIGATGFQSMSASEVKRRTGFADLSMLLGYATVVCNGDIDLLTSPVTCLTWLEEWFLYFEWKWGKTIPRLCDAAAAYKCSVSIAKKGDSAQAKASNKSSRNVAKVRVVRRRQRAARQYEMG